MQAAVWTIRWITLAARSLRLALLLTLAAGAAQAQVQPVRIGILEDMTGPLSDGAGPGTVAAVRLAVQDFGGTVLGRPIEVVSADHSNKPDVAAAIARQWYDRDGVTMITGLANSAIAVAVQQIARERGRIDIVTASASSDLTGRQCSPTGLHWVYDTYSVAAGVARGMAASGRDTWFFVTADYSFGTVLERDTRAVVERSGGRTLGSVRFPIGTTDFSSYLLQAQSSGAKVIAFASAGNDTVNAIKQSHEFGLTSGGQSIVGLLVFQSDLDALGLEEAQGLRYTSAFYWDADDASRAWTKRFLATQPRAPTMLQAGAYGAALHYLKAVAAAGTLDAKAVMEQMRATPINDLMTRQGTIRADGRVVRPMYLMEVKRPGQSTSRFDSSRIVSEIPAADAVRPLAESECPLVSR